MRTAPCGERLITNCKNNEEGNYVVEAFTYNIKQIFCNLPVKLIVSYFVSLIMLVAGNMPSAIHLIVALGIIDLFTGVLKAIKNKNVDSKKGFFGVIKILLYLIAVSTGVIVDLFFIGDSSVYGATYLISAFIIVNLAISILENLAELGVPVPMKLLSSLKKCYREIDSGGKVIPFSKK